MSALEDLTDTLCQFEPELTEESDILCPGCGRWSAARWWEVGEAACEDCGSHPAMICPWCTEHIDAILTRSVSTRRPEDRPPGEDRIADSMHSDDDGRPIPWPKM